MWKLEHYSQLSQRQRNGFMTVDAPEGFWIIDSPDQFQVLRHADGRLMMWHAFTSYLWTTFPLLFVWVHATLSPSGLDLALSAAGLAVAILLTVLIHRRTRAAERERDATVARLQLRRLVYDTSAPRRGFYPPLVEAPPASPRPHDAALYP